MLKDTRIWCGERVAQMEHEATLPMERAHRPRPFGCGLRVTVGSVRTRTVADPGRVFSFFATVVATTTSDSEEQSDEESEASRPGKSYAR